MASLQQGAGSNKSAKFVAANPLDPIVRPFEVSACRRAIRGVALVTCSCCMLRDTEAELCCMMNPNLYAWFFRQKFGGFNHSEQ